MKWGVINLNTPYIRSCKIKKLTLSKSTFREIGYYSLADKVAKGYSNATVRPSVRPSVTYL
jgi:hypothetical protein